MNDFAFWADIFGVSLYIVGDATDGTADWYEAYTDESEEEHVGQILNKAAEEKIEKEIARHLDLHK